MVKTDNREDALMFCEKEKSNSNEQFKSDKLGVARGPTRIPNSVCSPETSVAPGLSELGGKMGNSLLWYPWWPNRWAGSTAAKMMSLEERGAYHELLDWQWQGRGYLPSEPDLIAKLCGFNPTLYPAVLDQFPPTLDGRRANKVLLKIWEDQSLKHEKHSASAKKRWSKDAEKETDTETETKAHGDANELSYHGDARHDAKHLSWKTSYEIYLDECTLAYEALSANTDWIKQQEKFHPNIDIPLSLEKAFTNFWGTEAGWKHKKKARSKEINWKTTFTNAIDMNKVYKPRYGNNDAEKGRFTSV